MKMYNLLCSPLLALRGNILLVLLRSRIQATKLNFIMEQYYAIFKKALQWQNMQLWIRHSTVLKFPILMNNILMLDRMNGVQIQLHDVHNF